MVIFDSFNVAFKINYLRYKEQRNIKNIATIHNLTS